MTLNNLNKDKRRTTRKQSEGKQTLNPDAKFLHSEKKTVKKEQEIFMDVSLWDAWRYGLNQRSLKWPSAFSQTSNAQDIHHSSITWRLQLCWRRFSCPHKTTKTRSAEAQPGRKEGFAFVCEFKNPTDFTPKRPYHGDHCLTQSFSNSAMPGGLHMTPGNRLCFLYIHASRWCSCDLLVKVCAGV